MEGRLKRKESLTFHSEIAQARPVVPLFEIAALRRRYRSVTPPTAFSPRSRRTPSASFHSVTFRKEPASNSACNRKRNALFSAAIASLRTSADCATGVAPNNQRRDKHFPMTNALTIARYIEHRYRLEKKADIDEMKMHKLLYLVQRESLVRSDAPLFSDAIYAYQFGPVIKRIRAAFRDGSISTASSDAIPDEAKRIVDDVFDTYSDKNSWSLSRLTHAEFSWRHARQAPNSGGGERLMPVGDIRQDAMRIRTRRALRQSMRRGCRPCRKP